MVQEKDSTSSDPGKQMVVRSVAQTAQNNTHDMLRRSGVPGPTFDHVCLGLLPFVVDHHS